MLRNGRDTSLPQHQSRSGGEEGPVGDGGAVLHRVMGCSYSPAAPWAPAIVHRLNDFFFPLLLCYHLPPCAVGAQATSVFTLEKSQCAWVKNLGNSIFLSAQELLLSQAHVCNHFAQGPSKDTSLPPPTLTQPMAWPPSFASPLLFN